MAAELITQLRGSALEREAAYIELLRAEAEHNASSGSGSSGNAVATEDSLAEIAVACASPLCEVLCRDISEVSAEEWRRAVLVLTALSGVDPVRVGAECCKPDKPNMWSFMLAPDSALAVLLAKDPAALTLEDALLAGCAMAPIGVQFSSGIDSHTRAAGITTMEWMGGCMPSAFLLLTCTPTDDRNQALAPLLLELLKAPEELPEFALRKSDTPTRLSCALRLPRSRWSHAFSCVQLVCSKGSQCVWPAGPPSPSSCRTPSLFSCTSCSSRRRQKRWSHESGMHGMRRAACCLQ